MDKKNLINYSAILYFSLFVSSCSLSKKKIISIEDQITKCCIVNYSTKKFRNVFLIKPIRTILDKQYSMLNQFKLKYPYSSKVILDVSEDTFVYISTSNNPNLPSLLNKRIRDRALLTNYKGINVLVFKNLNGEESPKISDYNLHHNQFDNHIFRALNDSTDLNLVRYFSKNTNKILSQYNIPTWIYNQEFKIVNGDYILIKQEVLTKDDFLILR